MSNGRMWILCSGSKMRDESSFWLVSMLGERGGLWLSRGLSQPLPGREGRRGGMEDDGSPLVGLMRPGCWFSSPLLFFGAVVAG